jgi:hypothetical protein
MKIRAGTGGTMDRCQVPSRQDLDQLATPGSGGQEMIAVPVDEGVRFGAPEGEAKRCHDLSFSMPKCASLLQLLVIVTTISLAKERLEPK